MAIKWSFYFGLGLAVASSLFIGSSFIIKKKALIRLSKRGQVRAGSGGYGYLRDWVWWAGLLSLGFGEGANFVAYAFAPASLVTPLGALSVLVTSLLATRYLDERLNMLGKIGCCLCIIGSTVIVIHSPKEGQIDNLDQLSAMLQAPTFIGYVAFVIISSVVLIAYFSPRYGNSNVLIYILICSLIGSLSVMACKGLGLALRESFSGDSSQLSHGLFWIFLISVMVTVSIQMNYLNKSLDIFDTSVVTPIYYVFFTTFVLIASSILFKEWGQLQPNDILGNLCGFFTIIFAIFLLNAFRDYDITLDKLRQHWMKQRSYKLPQSTGEDGDVDLFQVSIDKCSPFAHIIEHQRSSKGFNRMTKAPKNRPLLAPQGLNKVNADDEIESDFVDGDTSDASS